VKINPDELLIRPAGLMLPELNRCDIAFHWGLLRRMT
jgi:hypothetical protein